MISEKAFVPETEQTSEVIIGMNSPEEELKRVQFYLSRKSWYEEHGYSPVFPGNPLLQEQFTDEEMDDRLGLLKEEYREDIYAKGVALLEASKQKIQAIFPTFKKMHDSWGFVLFPEYEIKVTRYGMGGSYDKDTGRIVMRVKDDGTFLRNQPHHTPIHEMLHIGTEATIVRRFGLNQREKERMIDRMVVSLFSDIAPDYRVHNIGNKGIEPYITPETVMELPEAIESYVKLFPRTV